ncbi:MAG: hypothetical protein RRY29_02475 [Desulfovibrionaceae bacterium]
MSRHNILVKVYGNLYPASQKLFCALQEACRAGCIQENNDVPVISLNGDLLCVSYEGVFFPLDNVLEVLVPLLQPDMQGKIDYIDLEAWTLTRHSVEGTRLHVSAVPLNNVMDYAGL